MKKLKDIIESQNFLVNKKLKTRQQQYEYFPKNKYELENIIIDLLKQGKTDLNCIDVSKIDNISNLFYNINETITVKEIDISEWNISNMTDMTSMFFECTYFTADLSNWDVSNVENMTSMFYGCENFDSNLSKWNVSNVKHMTLMFCGCYRLMKNNNVPKWYKGQV